MSIRPVINHFGLTVRDLERSTAFYSRFGAEVIADGHFCGERMDTGLGLRGVDLTTRMLRVGGHVIELLQYDAPEGSAYTSRNCDVGAAHIAFQVEDLPTLYAELSAAGVAFMSAPNPIEDGVFAGGYWVYFKDPDGISVELLQPGPDFTRLLGASDTQSG